MSVTLMVAAAPVVAADAQAPAADALPAWAQERGDVGWHALILAASTYDHARPLPAAAYDPGLISRALSGTRFGSVARTGGDRLIRDDIVNAVDAFVAGIEPGDVALIYFSGHGLNVGGIDYIVPSGAAEAAAGREPFDYLPVSWFVDRLKEAHAGVALVVIDACRSDPFDQEAVDTLEASLKPTGAMGEAAQTVAPAPAATPRRGIEAMSRAAPQTLVAFAAEPGRTAYSLFSDEPPERGSLFTRTLAVLLAQRRHALEPIIGAAGREVERLTGERQQPTHEVKGLGYLFLAPYPRFDDECEEVWGESVRSYVESGQDKYLYDFTGFYPASPRSPIARRRLAATAVASSSPSRPDAAGAPLATGVLQSIGRNSSAGVLATITDTVKLRRDWGGFLRSGVVRSLARGESVAVVPSDTKSGGVRVVTATGESGYVGGVRFLTDRDVRAAADIRFSGPGGDASPVQQDRVAALADALKAKGAAVRIVVGPSTDAESGRAAQISYLRSLRLRREVVAAGADPAAVTTIAGDVAVGPDRARIEVLAP